MRKNGFEVTYSMRKKAQDSNPRKIYVKCPDGEFISIAECARETGLSPNTINYRCKMGELQRVHGPKSLNSRYDFREWFYIIEKVPPTKRAVMTPHGEFESVHAAARAEGVTAGAICHKLRKKRPGYFYKDTNESSS